MILLKSAAMGDTDPNNVIVFSIFAAGMSALVVGYFVAWRSKRAERRAAGSVVAAIVMGFAGLFMFFGLMGAVTPFPPPDGSPIWEPIVFFLLFSPLPVGAFYLSAKFFRRAYQDDQRSRPAAGPPL
jgi:hypothetical protein